MSSDYARDEKQAFMITVESHLNTPYLWGGDNFSGLDCSGLVVEGLKACGRIGSKEDYSADMLWCKYPHHRVNKPKRGALIFWFNDKGKATHVAIAVNDFFCLTADGGGSKTKTVEDAIKQNAFIKIRPISHRKATPRYVYIFEA